MRHPDIPRLLKPDSGTRVAVVGLGKTGLSCARFLARRGLRVAVTDSRERPPGLAELREELPDVSVFLGGIQTQALAAAELILLSPGLPGTLPALEAPRQRGIPIVGDIELFAATCHTPVIGITGTNGKSTVTTLVGEMARAAGQRVAVGGNLGEPVLDLPVDGVDVYVLELSSFQLETTDRLSPQVAAILNISPDHLDRYPDMAAYTAAKARLLRGARCAVLAAEDARVSALACAGERRFFRAGAVRGTAEVGELRHQGEAWLGRTGEPVIRCADLPLPGTHNRANVAAAIAIGFAMGWPVAAMREAVRGFRGLAHRTERVATWQGVRYINDSKGTNVGATLAALEGLHGGGDGKAVLIAGGEPKDHDFAALTPVLARCARAVILTGPAVPWIAAAVPPEVPWQQAGDMDEAVRRAGALAQPGDSVLLSPACASFDAYRDYRHRGEVFRQAVRRLVDG